MKKSISLLIVLVLFACNKSDERFDTVDGLPPETQIGANTIGCLVNGSVLVPHSQSGYSGFAATYEYFDGGFYFLLSLSDENNSSSRLVRITLNKTELRTGLFILDKNDPEDGNYIGGGGFYFSNGINQYYTDSTLTGEINFTRVDLNASIVSGTFWFNAANPAGGGC